MTESEEQEPVLPSTINMPSTSRNTDVFETNDEFCSFNIVMPQEAVALKIGDPEESVRSVFPLFLSHFHLSVCAMQIIQTDQLSSNLIFHSQKKPDALTQQKQTDDVMTAGQNGKETKNTDRLNIPKGVESVTRIIAAPTPNITGEITNMDTLVSYDNFTCVYIDGIYLIYFFHRTIQML
jgi:hypothetical protein